MLRAKAAGIYDADFEDFAHRVLRAVFTELLSSEDDYTFYEIAFNRTFKFRRLDAYGEWLAATVSFVSGRTFLYPRTAAT